jgi:hypothetical protein
MSPCRLRRKIGHRRMLPTAILSNVDGNLRAAHAVLEDIQRARVSRIIFLGDAVGIGQQSANCVEFLRQHAHVYLLGWLEWQLVTGRVNEFPDPRVREALEQCQIDLQAAGCWDWLTQRPTNYEGLDFKAVNTDPCGIEYKPLFVENMTHSRATRHRVFSQDFRLLFVGGNRATWFMSQNDNPIPAIEVNDRIVVPPFAKLICSVGSVGQSRESDGQACYVILRDSFVEWRRIAC